MFELIGLIFGGASRLGQHWLDLKDKQKEREHEAVMFDLQVKLQDQRLSAEKDMRQMDATAKRGTRRGVGGRPWGHPAPPQSGTPCLPEPAQRDSSR